ncbi:MAG: aconitate hydratase, partial [Candidatus Aureabacteria bacterium]|nr:aconitate hydratase [Candidatus Auribacterota bacterium]
KVLPLRSNIPALSGYAFSRLDPSFPARARKSRRGFVAAGDNYGQGSSREHAALVPRYLGVAAVIAASFARIHQANLVNFGIAPIVLTRASDLRFLRRGDRLVISGLRAAVRGDGKLSIHNLSTRRRIPTALSLTDRARRILLAGGLLNLIKKGG